MVLVMAQRDEIYKQFGPILLEAQTLLLLEQINILRHNQGMPEITEETLLNSLNNHLSELQPYDWMTEE